MTIPTPEIPFFKPATSCEKVSRFLAGILTEASQLKTVILEMDMQYGRNTEDLLMAESRIENMIVRMMTENEGVSGGVCSTDTALLAGEREDLFVSTMKSMSSMKTTTWEWMLLIQTIHARQNPWVFTHFFDS